MKKIITIILLAIAVWSCKNEQKNMNKKISYPQTTKTDSANNYFGTNIPDPYQWLEDDNSTQTQTWVEAQNKLTFDYLQAIPFRDSIRQRLEDLWNYPRTGAPTKKADKYFFMKNNGLQNQSVFFMKDSLDGDEKLVLDPNTLSEDGTVALSQLAIRDDAKYVAYGVSRSGSDWNEIFILDLQTLKTLDDQIKWVKFSNIAWHNDGFFYSAYDEPKAGTELTAANEFHKVYFHKLGTKQNEDILFFEDTNNPQRTHVVDVTDDQKYLVLSTSESTSGNAIAVKDLSAPNSDFIHLITDFEKNYSVINSINDKLYIYTNDQAPRYQIVEVDMKNPEKNNWKTIVPENQNVIEWCNITAQKLIVAYMVDAKTQIEIISLDGKEKNALALPGVGSIQSFTGSINDKTAFYTFNSFTTPSTVYKYDFDTNSSELYFQPNLKFNPDDYIVKQEFYKSKDGTTVPMFIFHKKNIELNGKNPTLIYGYGGFNISLTPDYNPRRIAWIENGGVYAIPNLRGGGEYGEQWHKAGTLLNKQNVFDDCIAAAEYLIEKKYTSPQYLALQGGSNGGLLVGAVINQRPDLFKVALPAVGVMDMLRYHKFTIGYAWATDFGTSDDSVHFNNLIKYSPLHTIKANANYPAVLVTTADHDDRVVPAHSFKYIATLQELHKGTNPTLIRIETKSGHGSGRPIAKIIEEYTDITAFTFYNMGINPYK